MKRALDEARGLFTFTLIYAGERIRVAFKRDENIGILKERVAVAVRERGLVEIPISRMRLLHKSAILQPDSSPVYWIAGIGPDCEIILVENNPTVNIYRSVAQIPESSAINLPESFLQQGFRNRAMEEIEESRIGDNEENSENTEIAKRMKLIRCLQTNFSASVENGKKGGDPAERCRFNIEDSSEVQKSQNLNAKDLGEVVGQMAKSLEDFSSLLSRLSYLLIKDEKFRVKGNDDYRDFRRLFQNSIDCAKYLSPELEILSKFVIPLTPDKLGGLNLVTFKDQNENEEIEKIEN